VTTIPFQLTTNATVQTQTKLER